MPSKNAKPAKTRRIVPKKMEDYEEDEDTNYLSTSPLSNLSNYKKNKFVYIAIIIIALALLISYKKSWFVAAMVNGSPISNFDVLKEEDSQFRKQVIDQMVSEKLILDEANKKGVKISDQDIDAKIAEIEKQYGGTDSFNSLLAQQGQTRASVRNQIKVTLALDKMFGSEVNVTPEEVASFIEQNKDQMQSTDSAALNKEAIDIIKSQKQNQIFSQKFQELKKAANIQIF